MNPLEIKLSVNSIHISEKMLLVELYKQRSIPSVRLKSRELGVSYDFLKDCIKQWTFEGIGEKIPEFNYEIDTKDLSFSERLNLALRLDSVSYE